MFNPTVVNVLAIHSREAQAARVVLPVKTYEIGGAHFDATSEDDAYEVWAKHMSFPTHDDAVRFYDDRGKTVPAARIVAEDLPCTTCTVMVGSCHDLPYRALRLGVSGSR